MARKHESKWNIEDLADAEIHSTIRYLDPNLRSENEQRDQDAGIVIGLSLIEHSWVASEASPEPQK